MSSGLMVIGVNLSRDKAFLVRGKSRSAMKLELPGRNVVIVSRQKDEMVHIRPPGWTTSNNCGSLGSFNQSGGMGSLEPGYPVKLKLSLWAANILGSSGRLLNGFVESSLRMNKPK